MAGGRTVGRAIVEVQAKTGPAERSLRAFKGHVTRQMKEIGATSASPNLDLKHRQFDREILEARAKLAALDAEKANPSVELDKKAKDRLDNDIKSVRATLKRLQAEKLEYQVKFNGVREAVKNFKEAEARLKAIRAEEKKLLKEEQHLLKQGKEKEAQERRMLRLRGEARRQFERDMDARARSIQLFNKERDSVDRLQAEYIDLNKTIENYEANRRRAFRRGGMAEALRVDSEVAHARREVVELERDIHRLGSRPVRVPVEFDSDRALHRLRYAIQGVRRETGRSQIFRGFRLFAQDEIKHTIDRIREFGKAFRETRVDIGIFSIRLSHLMTMFKVLGPAVIETVAALGPLISVLGSGTLGLGALGVAIVGGAIPALAGFLGILVPTGKRLIDAVSAMNDYEKAIEKYGKGTEEAKEAQEDLNDALKGMGPETRRAAKQIMTLKNRWTDLTAPAQASLMRTIGDTIGYANENLGMFAKNTNTVSKTFETGIRGWLKGLNSIEGRNIFGDMMDNFNKSIGPVLKGLGSLMTYLGRVGRVASNFLPGFARQFQDWAQGVADGAKNAADLTRRVTDAVDSLRAVGRFALAGGRFLKAFFSAGVGQGQAFLQTITDILERWTEWAESDSGRRGIQDFFDRAIAGAKALIGFLANIAELVFRWADAVSPLTTAILNIANVFGDLINKALALNSTLTSVGLIGATFFRRQIWAATKFAARLASIGTLLRGIGAAAGGGMLAGGLFGGRGGRRGKDMENLTKKMFGVTAASTGLSSALGKVVKLAKTPIGKAGIVGSIIAIGVAAAEAGSSIYNAFERNRALDKILYQGPTGFDNLKKSVTDFGNSIKSTFDGLGGAGKTALYNIPVVGPAIANAGEIKSVLSSVGQSITDFFGTGAMGRDYADATERLGKNFEYAGNYLNQLRGHSVDAYAALQQQTDATLAAEHAQKTYNQAVRQYGKNSLEARSARQQLTQADNEAWYAGQQVISSQRQAAQAQKDHTRQLGYAIANMELARTIAKSMGDDVAYDKITEQIRGYRQEIKNSTLDAAIMAARTEAGLAPLVDTTYKIGQALRDTFKQGEIVDLAVKFPSPREAHQAMQAVRRAVEAGVPKKKAMSILLNASSAKKGIQELARLLERVSRRRSVQVDTRAIDRASTKLQKFIGIKLTPKEMRLALRGDKEVLGKIARISGMKPREIKQLIRAEVRRAEQDIQQVENKKLTPKEAKISAPGATEAAAQAATVAAAIRSIPTSWTSTVTTNYKTTGTPPKGRAAGGFAPGYADGGVAGFAAGGSTGATPNDERMHRAAERAARSQTRDIRGGGRVTRPTYLTGEENRPEIIISTNPRYRERNLSLLRTAARALNAGEMLRTKGIPRDQIISAAAGLRFNTVPIKNKKGKRTGVIDEPIGAFAKPIKGLLSRKKVNRRVRKAGRKKKLKTAQRGNKTWARRIVALQAAQSDWTREVSIRESQVKEPESFLKKVGETEAGDDIFAVDEALEAKFRNQMQRVIDAQNQLVLVTQRLIQEIPIALAAIQSEIAARRAQIKFFNSRIKRETKTLDGLKKANPKGDKAREQRQKAMDKSRKKISAWKGKVSDHKSAISTLSEDKAALRDDQKTAGFDLREYNEERKVTTAELGNPAKELARAQETLSAGGSSGGSGSTGLSIGEQRAAAAGEMRQTLAQYGSQAQQGGAAAVAGAMMGGGFGGAAGGGLGSVAAAMAGGVSGVGFGGIAGTGGGLGSAVSGGATASSMLGPGSSGGGFGTMAAGMGGIMGGGEGDKITTVNVTNNFQEPPADPHTWSAGLEFELGTI